MGQAVLNFLQLRHSLPLCGLGLLLTDRVWLASRSALGLAVGPQGWRRERENLIGQLLSLLPCRMSCWLDITLSSHFILMGILLSLVPRPMFRQKLYFSPCSSLLLQTLPLRKPRKWWFLPQRCSIRPTGPLRERPYRFQVPSPCLLSGGRKTIWIILFIKPGLLILN